MTNDRQCDTHDSRDIPTVALLLTTSLYSLCSKKDVPSLSSQTVLASIFKHHGRADDDKPENTDRCRHDGYYMDLFKLDKHAFDTAVEVFEKILRDESSQRTIIRNIATTITLHARSVLCMHRRVEVFGEYHDPGIVEMALANAIRLNIGRIGQQYAIDILRYATCADYMPEACTKSALPSSIRPPPNPASILRICPMGDVMRQGTINNQLLAGVCNMLSSVTDDGRGKKRRMGSGDEPDSPRGAKSSGYRVSHEYPVSFDALQATMKQAHHYSTLRIDVLGVVDVISMPVTNGDEEGDDKGLLVVEIKTRLKQRWIPTRNEEGDESTPASSSFHDIFSPHINVPKDMVMHYCRMAGIEHLATSDNLEHVARSCPRRIYASDWVQLQTYMMALNQMDPSKCSYAHRFQRSKHKYAVLIEYYPFMNFMVAEIVPFDPETYISIALGPAVDKIIQYHQHNIETNNTDEETKTMHES